jgi:hypothetical protein
VARHYFVTTLYTAHAKRTWYFMYVGVSRGLERNFRFRLILSIHIIVSYGEHSDLYIESEIEQLKILGRWSLRVYKYVYACVYGILVISVEVNL